MGEAKKKKRIKIIVATHKKYEMPKEDIYFPLHIGSVNKYDENGNKLDLGYQRDSDGDNISELNYCFGSQCGLYWAWKNLDEDYIGLIHYRRYFTQGKVDKNNRLKSIISRQELEPLLDKYKIIVPQKRYYYISTIYEQYANTINGGNQQLALTRSIICEKTPDYVEAFDKYMRCRGGFVFNMFIMPKDLISDYCSWLFPILFELHKRVDQTNMNDFDKRFCGRISERLFNVWLLKKIEDGVICKNEICQLPYTENVNWLNKMKSFLLAKIFKKTYGESF